MALLKNVENASVHSRLFFRFQWRQKIRHFDEPVLKCVEMSWTKKILRWTCVCFLHVFIRKIYHNERLLIKFRWSHPMSYHVIPTVPCHAEPVQVFWVQRSNYHDVLVLQVGKQKSRLKILSPIFSNLLHIVYMIIHVLLTNLLTYPYRTSNILLPCLLGSFGPFGPWRCFIMLDNAW